MSTPNVDNDDGFEDDDDSELVNQPSMLPSFSGAPPPTTSSWANRKSPTLQERASPGPTPSSGAAGGAVPAGGKRPLTPERQVGKKSKRELEMPSDGGTPGADSTTTPKKKPKKKKADAKEGAGAAGTPTKTTTKSPTKAKKDKDKDKEGEKQRDGDAVDAGGAAGGEKKDGGDEDPEVMVEEEADDDLGEDEAEKYKEEARARESELMNSCSEEEWKRYEAMRQSKFNHTNLKALMGQLEQIAEVTTSSLAPPVVFTMAGISKILVGEIVDNARLVRREWGEDETQPLQPRHVREAYTRLMRAGKIPECNTGTRKIFKRR